MAIKQAYQAYSQAIQTTPKTQQVIMLYDGAIRFLKQAREAIQAKHSEERFKLLQKSSRIITGLQSCLDFDNSEEVTHMSQILHRFYTGINVRVLSLNFQRNPSEGVRQCDMLISELQQMAQAWSDIDNNSKENQNMPSSAVGTEQSTASLPRNTDNSVIFSA